jgi:drug/metabolite transporter (DMT)-like permease
VNETVRYTRPYTKALFAVIVWGASFIATKISVGQIHPVAVIWLRFGIGVLVLGVAVVIRREFTVPSLLHIRSFALLGAVGITIHQLLQSTGLVTALASTTAWIVASTPVMIALISLVVLGERLRRSQTTGILLGAMGVLLVVSGGDRQLLFTGSFGTTGDVLVGLSTITWALFSVYSRKSLQHHPAASMMLYVMASGWVLTTVVALSTTGLGEIARLDTVGWIAILFLGVLCSGIAYIFWYDALKLLPASKVGTMLYLEPLVSLGVAAGVLGERITIGSLLGGAIILAGVWVVTRIR